MKKTLIALLFGALCVSNVLKAQEVKDDPIIIEIGDEKIRQSEFMKSFNQSNTELSKMSEADKRNALKEYVYLYTNFRLKIKAALDERYDTASSFEKEYSVYRDEIAAPYLIDSQSLENIMQEVYRRNQQAVRASHIMVALPRNPSPEDTLKAYNKAMDIYVKAIEKGADFKKLAIAFSEDPSVKTHESRNSDKTIEGNGGDLGYFSVFDMVLPFEDATYGLEIGEISKPIRSEYGYHIIKLVDKVNIYGKTSIQHIWVGSVSERDSARMLSVINDAYRRLNAGEDFNKVVQDCSEDRRSLPVNGLLEDVPAKRMVPEYVKEISKLKVGEYSQPFKTKYGWHIIKVVKKDTIPPLDDMRAFYKQRISRDQRSKQPQNVFVENMKEKYTFVNHNVDSKVAFDELRAAVTDSVFKRTWVLPTLQNGSMPAFTIGNKTYTVNDFAKYINDSQRRLRIRRKNLDEYYQEIYGYFVNDKIVEYADSKLEQEYPEFNEMVEEYRNGLLIFAYNDSKVWSKAILDTVGLKEFYAVESIKHDINNPEHAKYFWGNRADIMTVAVMDSNCVEKTKAMKVVEKNAFKEGMSKEEMTKLVEKKVNKKKCSLANPIFVRTIMVEKENEIIKPEQFKKGIYKGTNQRSMGYVIVIVRGIKDPELKSLRDARGYYINDYQNYLEENLIKELRSKYKVVVHEDKINAISY
ncbi:MAG: peptidylprolyl isomerase [Bacteroidales bacterium]|nr:peptidylprolyl isomerase [Bacteroidales bacterium]